MVPQPVLVPSTLSFDFLILMLALIIWFICIHLLYFAPRVHRGEISSYIVLGVMVVVHLFPYFRNLAEFQSSKKHARLFHISVTFQCYAAWYAFCPGLKVLSPYNSEDARGLLKAAIRDPDPVVFLENELLYGESFPISDGVLDSSFCLPIGKAKIERKGKHVTIAAYSKMVGYSLKAAEILEKDGIHAEVVNLRSIRPLDRSTINDSVRKTNRLVTVEEAFPQHGVGAEICACVLEESFSYLDAPVERIAGADVPMPYAANLERMAVPQVEDIVRAAKRTCYRSVLTAAVS
ncbi:Pyruvate dehydrogenase E1 component subunit beta-2 [Hibiscus syriacus]|uniref:Pyruvate dehydrogenase E1 component subunit beta n=1 Tax=Hibiscus syriacus TaxID=106335 RepID=A0A6A3C6Q6_HIBSY|nr:Pyruvate dehydrogenase E1 component subunit beta-2 [Hibiscus syriacus]